MTGIGITLFLFGILAVVGSFFITEKLSDGDVKEIQKIGHAKIKTVVSKELEGSKEKIVNAIENALDNSFSKIDKKTDEETNLKIQEISEYSDTVLTSMNKSHDEIIFMYDMLNKKQEEINDLIKKQEEILSTIRHLKDEVEKKEKEYLDSANKDKELIKARELEESNVNNNYIRSNSALNDNYNNKDTYDYVENISDSYTESAIDSYSIHTKDNKVSAIDNYTIHKSDNENLQNENVTNENFKQPTNYGNNVEGANNIEVTKEINKNNENKVSDKKSFILNELEKNYVESKKNINYGNSVKDKRETIVSLYKDGYKEIEIAKKTGLGIGEIKLILGLFNKK